MRIRINTYLELRNIRILTAYFYGGKNRISTLVLVMASVLFLCCKFFHQKYMPHHNDKLMF